MGTKHNVLQYEFFHVGGKGGSLETLTSECIERITDNLPLAVAGSDIGSGIKTVVRIYDTNGAVTRLVLEINTLKIRIDHYCSTPRGNVCTNMYARWQIRRTYKKIASLKLSILQYYVAYVTLARNGAGNVARETWRRTFRPAEPNELLELIRAAVIMKSFWLFIFEPNELLADKNQGIAYIM